jgi:hypothetical protein
VDNKHINVVTRQHEKIEHGGDHVTKGAATGAATGGLLGLIAGLSALVIPGIGPVIATGTIASTIASTLGMTAVGAGVGAAAGGLLGALIDLGFPRDEAEFYAEGVKRGGILVTVDTDAEHEESVKEILAAAGAVDMNTRRQVWKDAGWAGFNEYYEVDKTENEMSQRDRPKY